VPGELRNLGQCAYGQVFIFHYFLKICQQVTCPLMIDSFVLLNLSRMKMRPLCLSFALLVYYIRNEVFKNIEARRSPKCYAPPLKGGKFIRVRIIFTIAFISAINSEKLE